MLRSSSPPALPASPSRPAPFSLRAVLESPAADTVFRALGLLAVFAAAVVLGMQYVEPDKRVLQIIAAALIFGMAWKLDTLSGICLLLLTLPYPRGTTYGSTNVAFILLLLIIWLVRVSQLKVNAPTRTVVDAPIAGLVIAYALSFYGVERAEHLPRAFLNASLVAASLAMFYLIVNNARTGRDLQRLLDFQAISCATVCALSVWEVNHPGSVVVPGWIAFSGSREERFALENVRVGGPFFDYELLGEYCAMHLLLASFLLVRARTQLRRSLYGVLWVLVAFTLFATVTRGAMVALGAGLFYLLWILRRRVNFVKLTVAAALVVAAALAMNYYVAHFTRSGDVLSRLGGTRFIGWMPESRHGIWDVAFERWLQHPIVGMGPFYSLERGLSYWFWPHNVYLYYANIVGVVGLSFFLWLLWRLWHRTRPIHDDLLAPEVASAFLPIGHAMLFIFIVDEIKIEYLRSPIYQFQVWVFFAILAVAGRVAAAERVAPAESPQRRLAA